VARPGGAAGGSVPAGQGIGGGFPAAVGQGVIRQRRPTTPKRNGGQIDSSARINFVNSNNQRPARNDGSASPVPVSGPVVGHIRLGTASGPSRVPNNAAVEAFFATLKRELEQTHQLKTWRSRSDLANALLDYIEDFYNPQRIQQRLGYQNPIQFETAVAS
jgi:hypothetical protein